MFHRRRLFAVVGACAALVIPLITTLSVSSPGQAAGSGRYHRAVCSDVRFAWADCHALVATDSQGTPLVTPAPAGLSPATIDSVYGLPGGSAGTGKTIGIVDAYNDPTAASDLATFDTQFGLPSCTTSNGCFKQVNQTGGSSLPANDGGWSLEISLDIEWAHAVAPGANIVLVEASSSSFANLLTAEDYAKTVAQYVSNSWGGSEFQGETSYDSSFIQPGVSFFVAAGDAGLPAEYPSTSPNVISVGGTTLSFDTSGQFQSETGWTDGGGGCSSYETANPAQSAFSQYSQVSCAGYRATPDVASDADPNSGVAVYDSTPYQGQSGWFQVGGTSAASPMWAAASADAGVVVNAAYVYGSNINFRDITSGNNGAPCLVGFDLCSGRGSWIFSSGTTTTTTTTIPTSTTTVPVTTTTTTLPTSTTTSTTTTSTTTSTTSTTTSTTTTTTAPTTTTTLATPATPTNLVASSSRRRVSLSWRETTTGVTFDLYRSTSSGTETLYRSGITGTSYNDTSVSTGSTYYYEVTAVKSGVQSAKSNQASARG